jgi:hypothetical protein
MTTSTWNDSNDNWSTSADWTGGLPTSTSDVVVPVGDPQVTSAITINSLNDSAAVTFAGAGTCSVAAGVTNSGGLLVEDNGGIISPVGTSLSIGGTLINSGTVGIGTDGLFAAVTVNATAINNFIGATLGTLNVAGNTSHGIRFTPISATLNIGSAAGFGTAGVLSGSVNISGNPLGTGPIEFASGQITTIALNSELTLSGPDAFIADASNTTSSSALTGLSTITGALNLDNAPLSVSGALSVGGTMNIDDNDGIRGPGGSSVSVGGMLSNSGSVGLGVSDVSAPTNPDGSRVHQQ